MEVRRGKLPDSIPRPIEIDLSRDELVKVLTEFLKTKLSCADLKLDTLKGITTETNKTGSGYRLEGMLLTGIETVPLAGVEIK